MKSRNKHASSCLLSAVCCLLALPVLHFFVSRFDRTAAVSESCTTHLHSLLGSRNLSGNSVPCYLGPSISGYRRPGTQRQSKMATNVNSSNGPIKLFTYFRSSCSWRVRIALEWKNIKYESIYIDLYKGDHSQEEFRKLNPMQQIPALLINNQCLTQSLAMIEYLDEIFPEPPLLPKDPLQRFRVRQISETFASGIQPLQNLGCLLKVSDQKEKRIEFAAHFIRKGFEALEKLLKETSGKYCVGDDVTMADLCLIPQAAAAERYSVSLDDYPIIQRIYLALSELEPFKKAHAFGQEDCPAECSSKGTLKVKSLGE